MPDELSPRHLWRRLLEFAAVGVVIGIVVLTGPGLGRLRSEVAHASPGWLIAGVGLEVLSALSYVVIFRTVFCAHMPWRLSYQIGMSEQAANSVLSVSGTGGLALGAWALRRGGMSVENIGRKSVGFFVLTSVANVTGVAAFAALYAVGVLVDDRAATLTFGFGAAALAATVIVLAPRGADAGQVAGARQRPPPRDRLSVRSLLAWATGCATPCSCCGARSGS